MKIEYLLFNLLVISGPLALSFDRRVRYVKDWPTAIIATLITLIPFITWDSLVSGRHWWFNHQFTLPIRLLGLPLGEWLFFITVPFSCLFIWEIITYFRPHRQLKLWRIVRHIWILTLPAGVALFIIGIEYTGLVLIAVTLTILLDWILRTAILSDTRILILIGIVVGLILVFNGYLTARPVVLYDAQYQLDFRIITIPIEDFFYGLSHILLTVVIYAKLKARKHE